MKKPRRFWALILLLSFITTMNPAWQNQVRAAGSPAVADVYIERTDNSALETESGVVEFLGSNLKDLSVLVLTTGGGGHKILGTDIGSRQSNTDTFVKFELSGSEMRSINWSGGLNVTGFALIPVDEDSMPAITGVSPTVAYTGTDTITITGSHLDQAVLTFGNGDVNANITQNSDSITISDITGDLGLHDVVFTRTDGTNPGGITGDLQFCKLYTNLFRVVEAMNIGDLEMSPNTGVAGKTVVDFEAPDLPDCSVFFLKNLSDAYYTTNMGTNTTWISKTEKPGGSLTNTLLATVPAGLSPGTYKVLLTNKLTSPASGVDLRSLITKQMLVGDFTVISSTNAAQISSLNPSTGPTMTNIPVEIVGYNFEELKIDNLSVSDTVYSSDLSLSESDTLLTIDYGAGTYTPGGTERDVTVKREIKAIIGAVATFQAVTAQEFDKNGIYDYLRITTDQISDAAIAADPVQDVILEIKTIITDASTAETFIFTQQVVKENGFTFVKSYEEPVISDAVPDKIQVVLDDGTYETKEEMYIGIYGNNFTVTNYNDSSLGHIMHYPAVDLGGYLYFRRDGNLATDVYDRWGNEIDGASMEVYNNNDVVNGSTGNDTGNRILIKIPAGLKLKDASGTEISGADLINILTYVAVTNPRKESSDYGYTVGVNANTLIEFVEVAANNTPIINSVTPSIISTDGYNGVVIAGSKFEPNVQLYLEDKLLSCTRDANGKTLTFNAPAWKAGRTRLLVMNPGGGQDSIGLTYVLSESAPILTRITPPAGTINTLVTLDGSQFLSPDPTAVPVDLGIYRLIGTRVLFGSRDVNDYYIDTATGDIGLQDYSSAGGSVTDIIYGTEPVLADYCHSVLLKKSTAEEYYILKYSDDGDVVLTNGSDEYTIFYSSGYKATTGIGLDWEVAVAGDGITLTRGAETLALQMKTPYQFDLVSKEITGNRVKVTDNGRRIYAIVPDLIASGVYDVTVVNPDTNSATLKGAFTFYRQPQRLPKFNSIVPDTGSVAGGYFVHINGGNFESNGTIKTRVFINSIEVAPADVVFIDENNLEVKVPAYPGDLKEDWGTDRKSVPLALLNPSDGGAIGIEDAFTYILTSSSPVIDSLSKREGNAAGGEYIEIIGRDFRYYEPYEDDGDLEFNGEPYTDLYVNGAWDDFSNYGNVDSLPDPEAVNVLPRVYFGSKQAEIQNFGNGYLGVITPVGTAGTVDVYIVNNDYGISNRVKFTYKSSSPKITSVIPSVGKKQGNESVEILGSGFVEGTVNVFRTAAGAASEALTLVRFGDISNLDIERSGEIVNGNISPIELDGNMTVDYNDNTNIIEFTITQGGADYTGQFTNYDGSACYFDMKALVSGSTEYPGYELVKAYEQGNRLIIERGYAPAVDLESSGQLIVTTPSYYTVGSVTLRVINPDGGTAASKFEYKNPATSPYISNITRDGYDPVSDGTKQVLQVNYKGNAVIAVFGNNFLQNPTVQVGNTATIASKDITATLNTDPQKLSFIMPAVPESAVGTLMKVVVTNEDGGVASSDNPPSSLGILPIYILITKGETSPKVTSITPNLGPASGGTSVTITGSDFRSSMDGYGSNTVSVSIGGVPATNVTVVDYYTITCTTASASPGKADVKVENPDGENAVLKDGFTFISTPAISEVVVLNANNEETDSQSISIEGGQTLKITGTGFMAGCKVVFAPEIALTTSTSGGNLIYLLSSTAGALDTYELKSGTDGSNVSVGSSTTLTVVAPAGKLNTSGLMVVNPDNGASPIFSDISYALPRVDAPGGVTAILVHDDHHDTDRFIKVQWNAVDGATAYEVYVVKGSREYFLQSSIYTSLIFTDLEPNTSYKFIVKAVGNYGSSLSSEESERVRTGDDVGPPDEDGGLGEKTQIVPQGNTVIVNLGTRDGQDVVVDLTASSLAGAREVQVSVPAPLIYSGANYDVKIVGSDYQLVFNPEVFRNTGLENQRSNSNAGVKFRIYPYAGDPHITGGDSLSTVYKLEASSFVGQEKTDVENLYSNMLFTPVYDEAKARLRRFTKITLCYKDPKSGAWSPVSYGIFSSGQAVVNRMGLYCVIGSRG